MALSPSAEDAESGAAACSVAYDGHTHTLTINGVQIVPELIRAAFLVPGYRRHVIFEPEGGVCFVTSWRVDNTVTFQIHDSPGAAEWGDLQPDRSENG